MGVGDNFGLQRQHFQQLIFGNKTNSADVSKLCANSL
jgi:hypothetical protein